MKSPLTLTAFLFGLLAFQPQAQATNNSCYNPPGQLVQNCGFEDGDFTNWTLLGNDVPGEEGNLYGVEGTDPFDGISPNDGSYQAFFSDLISNATTLSQTIATVVGTTYAVSWYLAQDTTPDPSGCTGDCDNSFTASFAGGTLVSVTDVPVQLYTLYSFMVPATTTSSVISLTFGNDLGEFLLDDVSVVPLGVPEPSTGVTLLTGIVIGAISWRKRRLRNR